MNRDSPPVVHPSTTRPNIQVVRQVDKKIDNDMQMGKHIDV